MKTFRIESWAVLMLCIAAAPVLRAADQAVTAQQKKQPVVMRVYDVTTFCAVTHDRESPCAEREESRVALHVFPRMPVQRPTPASIADMIRNRVYPDSWDAAQGTSIEERAGKLVVFQRPHVHAAVADLFGSFEKLWRRQANVQALVVAVKPEDLLPWLNRGGRAVKQEDVDALVESGEVLAIPQVVTRQMQRNFTASGVQRVYLKGYKLSGASLEPQVDQAFEGESLEARTMLDSEAKFASVDFLLTLNAASAIETSDELGQALPEKARAASAEDRTDVLRAPIDRIARAQRRLHQTLRAPIGQWTVAGILPPAQAALAAPAEGAEKAAPAAGTDTHNAVVLVRVNMIEP